MAASGKTSDGAKGKTASQKAPRATPLEKLMSEDLQSLRLDEAGTAEFEQLRRQVASSRKELLALEAEDVAAMDDAQYDRLSASQARMTRDATAVVHFLAPRVMRLREGEAKRKWRSFVTKLQKDHKLV